LFSDVGPDSLFDQRGGRRQQLTHCPTAGMTVYKYGTSDRLDILRNCRIRFTPATGLNDPFELRPYFERIAPEALILERLTTIDLGEIYAGLPAATRSLIPRDQFIKRARSYLETAEGRQVFWQTIGMAMSAMHDLVPWLREKLAEGLGSRIGILSLSTVATNPLMWSHYADSHRGIVIGLDNSHPYFDRRRGPNDEFYWLRQVQYHEPTDNVSIMDLDGTEVLACKAPQWSYEQEWRMLALLSDAVEVVQSPAGPIHLFPLPPEAVVELIVGARSSATVRADAMLIHTDPRFRHVKMLEATLDDRRQTVGLRDLNV
jgi:hypothetical protein